MEKILREKKKRNNMLINILIDFSKDIDCKLLKTENAVKKYIELFTYIYSPLDGEKEFKHSYTDVFNLLVMVKNNTGYSIDNTSANMRIIYEYALDNIDDNKIIQKIEKLYDHITLDISKLNYINSNVLKKNSGDLISREQIRELKYKMRVTEDKIYDNNLKMEDIEENINRFHSEQVTVLSIFTAIVLSFVGGMVFSSSVLENIHKSSIYRLFFVVIIIGFVMVNIIWGLVEILHLLNKKIPICKLPFIIANVVLLCLAILSVASYKTDYFEVENKISEEMSIISECTIEIDKIKDELAEEVVDKIPSKPEATEKTTSTSKSKVEDKEDKKSSD